MIKHVSLQMAAWLLLLIGLSSCEKPFVSEESGDETIEEQDLCHLTFQVSQFEYIPFEQGVEVSRATSVTQVCTRISLAMFLNGEKVKTIHQDKTADGFGRIEVALPAGNYQVVAIAHSGDGSATITSPEEISFPNNKMTDTFYYYQEIAVGGSQSYNLEMKRSVAMFRLIMTDAMPDDVKVMRLYYTGGSSTFNAVTGFGAKNSRQTEERVIAEAQRSGDARFEVYTFPHTNPDELKITVSALSAAGDAVTERTFEAVPVKVNEITQYKGAFFQDKPAAEANAFTFTVNDSWAQKEYQY